MNPNLLRHNLFYAPSANRSLWWYIYRGYGFYIKYNTGRLRCLGKQYNFTDPLIINRLKVFYGEKAPALLKDSAVIGYIASIYPQFSLREGPIKFHYYLNRLLDRIIEIVVRSETVPENIAHNVLDIIPKISNKFILDKELTKAFSMTHSCRFSFLMPNVVKPKLCTLYMVEMHNAVHLIVEQEGVYYFDVQGMSNCGFRYKSGDVC